MGRGIIKLVSLFISLQHNPRGYFRLKHTQFAVSCSKVSYWIRPHKRMKQESTLKWVKTHLGPKLRTTCSLSLIFHEGDQ